MMVILILIVNILVSGQFQEDVRANQTYSKVLKFTTMLFYVIIIYIR